MAIYTNQKPYRAIKSVEFSTVHGGTMAFIHVADEASKNDLKTWLAGSGREILADTKVGGQPLLIIKEPGSRQDMLHQLHEHGDTFDLKRGDKTIDPWVIRSFLGFGGQSLQLASAFMRPGAVGKSFWHRVDMSVFVFAASNLVANAINLIYRAQNQEDSSKLHFLKQKTNDDVANALNNGEKLLDVDDKRLSHRKDEPKKKGGFNAFMSKYSVNIGELGLRYLGALGLALDLHTENIQKRMAAGKSILALNPNGFKQYAGISSIVGKTVALNSAIEDPYNPKPKTWWDKVREKYTFLAGGLIEVTSFSALAYDNFMHTPTSPNPIPGGPPIAHKHGVQWNGVGYRDLPGGIGASMFVTGYIVRSWAKYGTRHVNMDELYAHVSDTLAKVTQEKLPQLLADTAADLKEHFQGKDNVDYSTIYTKLVADLERYHHITVEHGKAVVTASANSPVAEAGTPYLATAPAAPGNKVQVPATHQLSLNNDKSNNIATA